ncbi:conserved hypothetical protein [Acidobacterium capsulatum ATCC 51196]|uniref:ABC-three component systems C-terminal domain-containing protein n=1 Tax=Acidobacterium capsulatum (strain ATCC 51196 / DSM 11244 / BCRC 80197 / JCM 7670 / NBRC 15755 / NCIMB 13165 / 161) TaxID=240015 RepID=C1F5T4_ACIC5|nr:conserved hypothetical protein [Acidobacterium capsulatum ATCC 51196]
MANRARKPKDVLSRKSAQVPGQLFGYSMQPIRLLSLALNAAAGTTLSLEVFEDVGSVDGSGNTLASQTKSALKTNPVSDRAVDLWKTFSNWKTAITSGQLSLDTSQFEIYLAKRRTGKLVHIFHDAQTEEDAKAAFEQARADLWGPGQKYPKKKNLAETLAPYVNHVLDDPPQDVIGIIQRFSLSVAAKDPLRDLRPKVVSKWVRPESVDAVIQHAHGWIKERLDGLLQEGKTATLNVDEFNVEMQSFLPRIDFRQILTSVAGTFELTDDTIAAEHLRTYVRQLELIEHTEEDVIEAINQFLRASAERSAWSEQGIVHDKSFDEYEEALVAFWKNKRSINDIVHKSLPSVERGKLLLADCGLHQQKLQGLEPPPFFTPGSFHALAENQTVGWHPEYRILLSPGACHGDSE